jgi:hypothetical protein
MLLALALYASTALAGIPAGVGGTPGVVNENTPRHDLEPLYHAERCMGTSTSASLTGSGLTPWCSPTQPSTRPTIIGNPVDQRILHSERCPSAEHARPRRCHQRSNQRPYLTILTCALGGGLPSTGRCAVSPRIGIWAADNPHAPCGHDPRAGWPKSRAMSKHGRDHDDPAQQPLARRLLTPQAATGVPPPEGVLRADPPGPVGG